MTEKELMSYHSLLLSNERYRKEMKRLQLQGVPEVCGKVKGSSIEFPYTERRTKVQMEEPFKAEKVRSKISELEEKIEQNEGKAKEIEQYIDAIDDPSTKLIFEMRCKEHKSWVDIAEEMVILDGNGKVIKDNSRTTYFRKFKKYLQKCT